VERTKVHRLVNTERFIALIKSEPVNYTEWQRTFYADAPLETFLRDAVRFREMQTSDK
jgi:hypothetical protein